MAIAKPKDIIARGMNMKKRSEKELDEILSNIELVYKNRTIGDWHKGQWAKPTI